jgi:hypothetical protein
MTIAISGTTGITLDGQFNSASSMGFKNRIINGAMVIDQRNAGASVTINTAASTYTIDRWNAYGQGSDGVFTVQQSSTAPSGFTNSLAVTVTTADASIGAAQLYTIGHKIEGYNIADLGWGTASAKSVCLSFQVRSSVTGTFSGSLKNSNGTRSYPFTYTISVANTWEQKTVTIAGDTTGTWLTTNGIGLTLTISLGSGSNRLATAGAWAAGNYDGATGAVTLISTNGATFYITGVQLEKGSTATSFDYRPYGTELSLCQRYYYRTTPGSVSRPFGNAFTQATTEALVITPLPVTLRTPPTALEQSGTAGDYSYGEAGTSFTCSSVPVFSVATVDMAVSKLTVASGLTVGRGGYGRAVNATTYLGWSAEL